MMQSHLLQPSWPLHNIMNSDFDQELSPSITTSDNSPTNSSASYFQTIFSDEFSEFPVSDDEMQVMLPMEEFEDISNDEIEDVCRWLNESEGEGNFYMEENDSSEFLPSTNKSLILPSDDMVIDSQVSLSHLLEAYGEAMDLGQSQLADVILGCINAKVSPAGDTLERVVFNLFQTTENQGDYINQESRKTFGVAFRSFYEIFLFGRFPHFAANSAILEAMPEDADTIHVIDFDIGEGIQWPPIIEAISRQKKSLRLTSVKFQDDSWKYEETKWRLHEYARSFGLKMKVEEMRMEDLMTDVQERNRANGKEWLAFNCMANLPHMGRMRNRSDIVEFLRVAQGILANSSTHKGMLSFGQGENGEKMKNCSKFSSFFDENLRHCQAVFESMECSFPTDFAEARLAMENLFLKPYVSSMACFKRWEEIRSAPVFEEGDGLEGLRLGEENIMEAKEMVKEGATLYEVRIEGQNGNEMILEWRGTPLVRVSTWM